MMHRLPIVVGLLWQVCQAAVYRTPLHTAEKHSRGNAKRSLQSSSQYFLGSKEHLEAFPVDDAAFSPIRVSSHIFEAYSLLTVCQNLENVTYIAQLDIGNPPQSFNVSINLSDGELFVPSVFCRPDTCEGIDHFYDPRKSATYKKNGTAIRRMYLGMFMSGRVSQDTVRLAGIEIKNQSFGEADTVFQIGILDGENADNDGVLGLAPNCTGGADVGNGVREPRAPNPFLQMISEGRLDRNVFSLRLPTGNNSGAITFGEIDEDLYRGNLIQIPLSNRTEPLFRDRWRIDAESIFISDQNAPWYSLSGYTAWLDTTSPAMVLPAPIVDFLHKRMGISHRPGPEPPAVPCESRARLPDLNLHFGGHKLTLTPYQYLLETTTATFGHKCYSMFIPSVEDEMPPEIPEKILFLGSTFLSAFYSVFDLDNRTVSCKWSSKQNP